MAKKSRDSFNADYDALFSGSDPELFDIKEYEEKRRAGEIGTEEVGNIDVNEMIKALEGLEAEKSRLKGKRWYEDTESPELKKAKYGDIPEQFSEIPDARSLRGEQPEIDSLFEDEPEKGKDSSDSLFDDEKPKAVSVEKTKVTKAPFKSSMPNVIVDRDTSLEAVRKELDRKKKEGSKVDKPKESVKLSPKNFKTEEIKLEPETDDEGRKTRQEYLGAPDPGVEEDEIPWMVLGAGGLLKGLGRSALKGAGGLLEGLGSSALKGAGKSTASEIGKSVGTKVPPAPSASRMLQDKIRLAAEEAGGTDALMFGKGQGKSAQNLKGTIGRRLDLISKDSPDARGIVVGRGKQKLGGNRSSLFRHQNGGEDVTDITQSDLKRLTKDLTTALKSGNLTPEKYANILRRLGRSDVEVQAELARAGLK
jgi:hypothetical protein